jgi:dephospho-CoA kinase
MSRDSCDWCDAPGRSQPCYLSVTLRPAYRYCPCVLRIGLTGGIGSGKSTVSRLLAERGARLVDADVLAREVVQPGTPGLAAIEDAFGSGVLTADGALDRPALAAVVFADPEARRRLDGIVHPLVRARAVELIGAMPADAVVVQDIPLLVETGQADSFDLVLVVEADPDVRVARLVARGMTEADASARIASQATDAERRAVADVVLDNSGTLEELAAQVDRFWIDRVEPARETGPRRE